MSEFDQFAKNYDASLNQGLALSGEKKEYFAQRRIEWLKYKLGANSVTIKRILDFGCGTGASTSLLLEYFDAECVVGVDTSAESLAVARRGVEDARISFLQPGDIAPGASYDLIFCNGVFHHIPSLERAAALKWIKDRLSPDGRFVMWENNPLNVGTQIVMSRIPFDRDAETITHWKARRLMESNGYNILNVSHLFVFPGILKMLRRMEGVLSVLPIGAQYQVIARKQD